MESRQNNFLTFGHFNRSKSLKKHTCGHCWTFYWFCFHYSTTIALLIDKISFFRWWKQIKPGRHFVSFFECYVIFRDRAANQIAQKTIFMHLREIIWKFLVLMAFVSIFNILKKHKRRPEQPNSNTRRVWSRWHNKDWSVAGKLGNKDDGIGNWTEFWRWRYFPWFWK